ncbi:alpha/beta hydrolase [Terrimonas sp. NA20]|uniref:Alpha/beta hydrolase n=1 Tax=Terrimonas ginsenosidimutans TaxID=2908004 RepID=A0ABS9KKT5_9BACT|nr:alpha/beta hydrolase [Terrimonas ginsenosidimutans]MCG2612940.1 alpha/beta hydrolase [Terrimonas ginsenosidimutans]
MRKLLALILSFMAFYATAQEADSIVLKNAVLYYYSYGSGEAVIILSGGPGVSAHQEDDLAIVLSKKYRAILFDQRGTGRSRVQPFDSTTINLGTALSDLDTLRKHLKQKQLTISGHSWGAILAAAYAEKYPANVRSLMLIGPGELDLQMTPVVNASIHVRDQIADDSAFYYWSDSARAAAEPARSDSVLRRITWSNFTCDRKKLDSVMIQVNHGSYSRKMGSLMWYSLVKQKFNIVQSLRKKYKGDALIIFGWQDPVGSITYPMYEKAFPKATIKGINKCGHMPSVEQPTVFYEAILNFLDKRPPLKNR